MKPSSSRLTRTREAISQLVNVVVFNGDSDEMLSSRTYREGWTTMQRVLDLALGKDHCKQSYEWEKAHYRVDRFNGNTNP